MNKIIIVIFIAINIGVPVTADNTSKNVIPAMRAKVFELLPGDIGINRKNHPEDVWGVLMETGFNDGEAYSLIVLADGTTSVYFTTGAGIIGAGDHDHIRKVSYTFLEGANYYKNATKPTTSNPLPGPGQVTFYFLSYTGVLTHTSSEEDLGSGKDELASLFHAGHNVIAEVRKIEEGLREGNE